jgi:N-acyl-L-homoserine lactone synthetase
MRNTEPTINGVGARAHETEVHAPFTRNIFSMLERVEYRFCDSGEDLESIYRLRYNSYLDVGMVKPDASRMVNDQYDEMPNSYRFGVFYEGHLVSTIRLHHASQEFPVSPSTDVFADELQPRVAAGESFIDPSRFAADLQWSTQLRVLPYLTLRLAVVACKYFNPTYCLTAIKEEHAAFYHRIFRSVQAAEPRMYPGLTMPVHLYQSRCSDNMEDTITRFPFFRSTAFEQRLLFQRTPKGELAPLTILPTAKYFSDAA